MINHSKPIYIQIADSLESEIILGQLKPGEKLAEVRELSNKYCTNPNLLIRSLEELEGKGLLYSFEKQYYVTEDVKLIKYFKEEYAEDLINNLFEEMKRLGYSNEETKKFIDDIN